MPIFSKSVLPEVEQFHSSQDAKEFLIARIVEEANRENVLLSELERKMLYFSETGWTLPDIMEVCDQFEDEYDDEEYEKKIARLIVNASKYMRRHSPQQYEAWWASIKRLSKEDHYILVLNMRAGLRPPGDLLRLWLSGLVIVGAVLAVTLALAVLSSRYNIDLQKYGSRDVVSFAFWIAALVLVVVYSLIRFVLGPEKLNLLIAKLVKKVAGHE